MARKAFYSFHYLPDAWRAGQVRNMGMVEGNAPVSDNAWETITDQGDQAIRTWIDGQLSGRSCTIVLVGANTARRKWIDYEIKKSWDDRKGVVGIHVHGLKDRNEAQSSKGANPFSHLYVGSTLLSNIVKTYDPPFSISTNVYNHISENLEKWVEEAVAIRARY
jgi:hypothetical protein